jgi:Transposase DDE domain
LHRGTVPQIAGQVLGTDLNRSEWHGSLSASYWSAPNWKPLPSSQGKRKRIEECFGWIKTIGTLRTTRHRGRALVEWFFVLTAAAYNLARIPKILAVAG